MKPETDIPKTKDAVTRLQGTMDSMMFAAPEMQNHFQKVAARQLNAIGLALGLLVLPEDK